MGEENDNHIPPSTARMGELIGFRRTALGLSQKALAELCGINRLVITRLEGNKLPRVDRRTEVLNQLIVALRCNGYWEHRIVRAWSREIVVEAIDGMVGSDPSFAAKFRQVLDQDIDAKNKTSQSDESSLGDGKESKKTS